MAKPLPPLPPGVMERPLPPGIRPPRRYRSSLGAKVLVAFVAIATVAWWTVVLVGVGATVFVWGLERSDCACGNIARENELMGSWLLGAIVLPLTWWFVARFTRGPEIR